MRLPLLLPLSPAQLDTWAYDPGRFAQEALLASLWSRQVEILQALLTHPRVAVRSGHKTGCTTAAAVAALWWAATRPGSRVVLMSNSTRVLKAILWATVRQLEAQACLKLGVSGLVVPPDCCELANGSQLLCLGPDAAEEVAGIGDNTLFIIDNAHDLPDRVFEVLAGNLIGGSRALLVGKPLLGCNHWYRSAFDPKRIPWHALHLSSEETPNVLENSMLIPGLATAEWVEDLRSRWGQDSSLFQSRVLGNFPPEPPAPPV